MFRLLSSCHSGGEEAEEDGYHWCFGSLRQDQALRLEGEASFFFSPNSIHPFSAGNKIGKTTPLIFHFSVSQRKYHYFLFYLAGQTHRQEEEDDGQVLQLESLLERVVRLRHRRDGHEEDLPRHHRTEKEETEMKKNVPCFYFVFIFRSAITI